MKMGKGNFSVVGGDVTESRDKEQVTSIPSSTLGSIGGTPLFNNQVAEDPSKDDNGKSVFIELDEENSPRLPGDQWAKLVDCGLRRV
jgi:hypothetical protein